VALSGALISLALMLSMPAGSWWRLGVWLVLGLGVYAAYARYSGRLRAEEGEE
jgi:APA family basic amino acid/polyamine antiporter